MFYHIEIYQRCCKPVPNTSVETKHVTRAATPNILLAIANTTAIGWASPPYAVPKCHTARTPALKRPVLAPRLAISKIS